MKKIIACLFFFVFFYIAVFKLPVFGQQLSLSINPPLIETVIKPGKSIMIAYSVQNGGDPVIAKASVVSFRPRDNFGNISLGSNIEGPVRFSLDNADLKMNQNFFLKTGQNQQLLLKIRVPEKIKEGDYYYSLLVETTPPSTIEGIASSKAKATIASNILITVTESGIVEINPKITIFDVIDPIKLNLFGSALKIFDSFDKIPVVLYVQNRGINKIVPSGNISLRNVFGQSANYQLIGKNILSSSQRLIEATPSPSNSLHLNRKMPVSLIIPGFFVGPYHLQATVSFGENSPTLFAKTSFIAVPFKLIMAIFILIAISVLIIKTSKKWNEQF